MDVPTEQELQELFDSAQKRSKWAKRDPHNFSLQDMADEVWANFHSAMSLWEQTTGKAWKSEG